MTCGAQLHSNGFVFTCTRRPHKHGDHMERVPYEPTAGHPEPFIETYWTDEELRPAVTHASDAKVAGYFG